MRTVVSTTIVLLACGSPMDEVEHGSLEQELGTKFSSVYTHGVSKNPKREACTVANGGGVSGITYHHCMLPGTAAITYQMTGADPYEEPAPSYNLKSWKFKAAESVSRLNALLDEVVPSNGWSFTQITVQPATVTIMPGTCSGDALTSENIQTFVCTTFPAGSTVTESLAGIYKKWTGGMIIKVDLPKIEARAAADVGCNQCASFRVNMSQLLEHGLFAAVAQAVGSGTIDRSQDYWNDPTVTQVGNLGQGQGYFNSHDWADGDACRAGHYSVASPTTFAALSGSCANQ